MTSFETSVTRLKQTQDTVVRSHAGLVKRIANHLLMKLPTSIQFDDLYQSGMLGLLEAARNYDDSKGASFETYASIRIRGQMLDEVRKAGWMPRSVYKNSRLLGEAVKKLEHRLGREPLDAEVAKEMNLELTAYFELVQDALVMPLCGFEDLGQAEQDIQNRDNLGFASPQDKVMRADFFAHLSKLIDSLPKNERLVLILHYERDLNLKEIGDILAVSESRVSQIHSQATSKVRSRLKEMAC